MVDRSTLDPIAEARARVRLRYTRARNIRQPGKPIGQLAQRIARKAMKDKGPSMARLKLQWREIVGEDIAKYCRPDKLTGSKDARTLSLRVIPAAAPMIQHQSELIRQRVSVAAGGTLARVKLVQGSLDGRTPPAKPRTRVLTREELDTLERDAAGIEDPALRAAIVRLGTAMLSRET